MRELSTIMVERVDQWPWSSYPATVGSRSAPDWLTTEWVLSHFGTSTKRAQTVYQRFVADGLINNRVSPWQDLRGQLFLGSEDFLRQMKARIAGMETGSVYVARQYLRSTAVRMPNRPTRAHRDPAGRSRPGGAICSRCIKPTPQATVMS